MKLLFEENLSHRLVDAVARDFPGSAHLRDVDLVGAPDARLWEFARANGFALVSKDSDFRQRSFVAGTPPKVIWLDVGNDGTAEIASLLSRSKAILLQFAADGGSTLLVLSKTRSTP